MLGNLINGGAIFLGSLAGLLLGKNLKSAYQEAAIGAASLALLLLGLQMGLQADNFIIMIVSLTLGSLLGHWLDIEGWMDRFGLWVESRLSTRGEGFNRGFVYASLLFCIGPMGIMGSIQSGLAGDHSILITKAVIDGIFAVVLSVTIGWGVIASSLSVLAYQGAIVLSAQWVQQYFTESIITEMTATGGMLIVAIALNLLEIKKYKTANMLPALLLAGLMAAFWKA